MGKPTTTFTPTANRYIAEIVKKQYFTKPVFFFCCKS